MPPRGSRATFIACISKTVVRKLTTFGQSFQVAVVRVWAMLLIVFIKKKKLLAIKMTIAVHTPQIVQISEENDREQQRQQY